MLPDLDIGQEVHIAPIHRGSYWKTGTCLQKLSDRSYLVETDGEVFQQNRQAKEVPTLLDETTEGRCCTPSTYIAANLSCSCYSQSCCQSTNTKIEFSTYKATSLISGQGPKLRLPGRQCDQMLRAGNQNFTIGHLLVTDFALLMYMYSEKLIKNKIHSHLQTI